MKKILVMGLPGAGKTTLASALALKLCAVHFNADEVRKEINSHLGFSTQDRIEQARRMGWLCDVVVRSGHIAIADFVCPTEETRNSFGTKDYFLVWIDRIQYSRFENTNQIFSPPKEFNVRVLNEGGVDFWIERILGELALCQT
jgi:adenylylsulfate kinase